MQTFPHQDRSAHPTIIQETAFAALQNIGAEVDRFLVAIEADLGAALRVGAYRPDVTRETAYLRETMIEHLRVQLFEAHDAARDYSDVDPMKPAIVAHRAAA